MRNLIKAFNIGFTDGRISPLELTSGITYSSKLLNNAYDLGVNIGQVFGKIMGAK